MKIYLLIGQRKCSYPGQYAPELLDSIDSLSLDENSDFLTEREAYHRDSEEFSKVAWCTVHVNDKAVDKLLKIEVPDLGQSRIKPARG